MVIKVIRITSINSLGSLAVMNAIFSLNVVYYIYLAGVGVPNRTGCVARYSLRPNPVFSAILTISSFY